MMQSEIEQPFRKLPLPHDRISRFLMTAGLQWITCSVLVLFHLFGAGPLIFAAGGSSDGMGSGHRCGTTDWGVLNSLGREALRKLQL